MKMAQKKDPTNQAAIKTQMKRMEVETTMTRTKTLTKTQMGTPMQVAKRRRARWMQLMICLPINHHLFKMLCQSFVRLCLIWTVFQAQLTQLVCDLDRLNPHTHQQTTRESSLHRETTSRPDKVLVNKDSLREETAEIVTTSKMINTLIKNQILHRLYPAKIRALFFHILKLNSRVFIKCRHNQYISNISPQAINLLFQNMFQILTLEKLISTPSLWNRETWEAVQQHDFLM